MKRPRTVTNYRAELHQAKLRLKKVEPMLERRDSKIAKLEAEIRDLTKKNKALQWLAKVAKLDPKALWTLRMSDTIAKKWRAAA